MSLTKLLRKKSQALVLGTALSACAADEVHNHFYDNNSRSSGSNITYDCEDIYYRYVEECHANGNDPWKSGPDGGLPTYECVKGKWPQSSPEWTQCLFEVPCEQINYKCDPLFNEY